MSEYRRHLQCQTCYISFLTNDELFYHVEEYKFREKLLAAELQKCRVHQASLSLHHGDEDNDGDSEDDSEYEEYDNDDEECNDLCCPFRCKRRTPFTSRTSLLRHCETHVFCFEICALCLEIFTQPRKFARHSCRGAANQYNKVYNQRRTTYLSSVVSREVDRLQELQKKRRKRPTAGPTENSATSADITVVKSINGGVPEADILDPPQDLLRPRKRSAAELRKKRRKSPRSVSRNAPRGPAASPVGKSATSAYITVAESIDGGASETDIPDRPQDPLKTRKRTLTDTDSIPASKRVESALPVSRVQETRRATEIHGDSTPSAHTGEIAASSNNAWSGPGLITDPTAPTVPPETRSDSTWEFKTADFMPTRDNHWTFEASASADESRWKFAKPTTPEPTDNSGWPFAATTTLEPIDDSGWALATTTTLEPADAGGWAFAEPTAFITTDPVNFLAQTSTKGSDQPGHAGIAQVGNSGLESLDLGAGPVANPFAPLAVQGHPQNYDAEGIGR